MRIVIIPLAAVAGLIALATPGQAAPTAPREFAVAAPATTMVRQRCGQGMKRQKAWQDKNGAWHGKCVPKH
jgi:hypothetical protein